MARRPKAGVSTVSVPITEELIRRVSQETGARGPAAQKAAMGVDAYRQAMRERGRLGGIAARGKSGRRRKVAATP